MSKENYDAALFEQNMKYLQDSKEDTRKRHGFLSMLKAENRRIDASLVGDREQFLTWTIANEAYEKILEDNIDARQALTEAAENHTEEVEAVLAEKSRQSKGLNKSVIENNDSHPVQKDMQKRKKFQRQGMKNTSNVWQMLNLLSYFREAYEEALELEKVKQDVQNLKSEVDLAKEEINRLHEQAGTQPLTNKEKASLLKSKGYRQVDVAKALKVSKQLVGKWWTNI
jgi:Mg2+ and Co2+ transporter CorA